MSDECTRKLIKGKTRHPSDELWLGNRRKAGLADALIITAHNLLRFLPMDESAFHPIASLPEGEYYCWHSMNMTFAPASIAFSKRMRLLLYGSLICSMLLFMSEAPAQTQIPSIPADELV